MKAIDRNGAGSSHSLGSHVPAAPEGSGRTSGQSEPRTENRYPVSRTSAETTASSTKLDASTFREVMRSASPSKVKTEEYLARAHEFRKSQTKLCPERRKELLEKANDLIQARIGAAGSKDDEGYGSLGRLAEGEASVSSSSSAFSEDSGLADQVISSESPEVSGASSLSRTKSHSAPVLSQTAAMERLMRWSSARDLTKATRLMFKEGTRWRSELQHGLPPSVKAISMRNIARLRVELENGITDAKGKQTLVGAPLSVAEQGFIERLKTMPFVATHATEAPVEYIDPSTGAKYVKLLSRRRLEEEGTRFSRENSDNDIRPLATHDFVFFSVEPGREPSKPSSRFGRNLYAFDLDNRYIRDKGWMSLNDMLKLEKRDVAKHIPELTAEECERYAATGREYVARDLIFSAKDMREGLALSLVKVMRQVLSDEHRNTYLNTDDPGKVNALVNGFFRPEIKVASSFFAQDYIKRSTAISGMLDGSGKIDENGPAAAHETPEVYQPLTGKKEVGGFRNIGSMV
ncbi:hypothetical protein FJU08_01950 [Martelella alba]|uniref:Uncharacterized protein n=1 Tax=Martelella alba TaxID=2590451 RepID=A0A506UJ51_9HYPH|nr:hypothetical protein [Martelella alba]TPW33347.1 hypothetical protein FJU08_01950 [Martelella alba]